MFVKDYLALDGYLHMRRWSLFRQPANCRSGWSGMRIYVHHVIRPDLEDPHNHPWKWALSIVFRGWYTECVDGSSRLVRWFNWMPSTKYHQIVRVSKGGAWSLMLCGPKTELPWDFKDANGKRHPYAPKLLNRGIDVTV